MASKKTDKSKDNNFEDLQGPEKDNQVYAEGEQEVNGKSENERRFEEEMAAFELTKPWPPLLEEMRGKPRSYSDTSQIRAMSKAPKEDVRCSTSYMHLPHISGQLKRIQELQGSLSSPHLHQSFSRMHLPHIDDPWNPGEDYPTVSVIALAEERDRGNTDDAITDKEEDEAKEDFVLSDDEENDVSTDTGVNEHAIYTWNREMGRTRSLSEPSDLVGNKDTVEQRPRALSMESADKAKKPPSRLQFQMTLSGLEEHHDEHEYESDDGRFNGGTDTDELDIDNKELTRSVLVLAESSELIPETESSEQTIAESDSSDDQILTRWSRHDSRKRSTTFSSELETIDENKNEINSLLPILSGSSSGRSVKALVDKVARDVMDRSRSSDKIVSTGDPSENESEESIFSTDSSLKRRMTLPAASPLRKTQAEYATTMEREAFGKISKWKTKFASKLEDVLRKGVDVSKDDEEKQSRKVVVDVPMNLSPNKLKDLKKNMISELVKRSSQGEAEGILSPKPCFRPKIKRGSNNVADKLSRILSSDAQRSKGPNPLDLYERLQHLQREHGDGSSSETRSGVDNMYDARSKIAELFQWHDHEREQLMLEMRKLLANEKPLSASLSQSSIDQASLEKVFLSLQSVTDTIFRETISRLKGTIPTGLKTGGDPKHDAEKAKYITALNVEPQQLTQKKVVRDAICQTTTPPNSKIHVPIKKDKKSSNVKGFLTEDKFAEEKDTSSTSNVSSSPNHVHTRSLADHICHKDTRVGADEETEGSFYTTESSAHSCECDFGSDETYTSEREPSTGESSQGHRRFGDETSQSTSMTNIDDSSSSTVKSESNVVQNGKKKKKIDHVPFDDSEDDDSYANESDACSELADLLGVYRVYNLNNDRDNDVARPQTPEPMTYEEKELLDKIKRQKGQLKSSKRKLREFKIKNRRLKEQLKQLEMQHEEYRDDFLVKDNRISDLKREVDHLSLVMQKYKKALEDKSNIIKHKDQQIVTLLHSEEDSSDRSHHPRLKEMEKQLKKALDDNVRLRLKLSKKGTEDEPGFFNEGNSELQTKLESAYGRTSELENELRETKQNLAKAIAEKEIKESGGVEVDKQSVKEALKEKDEMIKELEIQQSSVVQELTEKMCEVMTERNNLIHNISELSNPQHSEDLEKGNDALKEEIAQLKKALEEAEARHFKNALENDDFSMSSLGQNLHESAPSTSSDMGNESEVAFLKTALDGYQMLTQRLVGHQNNDNPSFEYEEKLEAMVNSAHSRCAQLEENLKKVISAKEKEKVRHQETAFQLQRANQKIQDLGVIVENTTNESLTEIRRKCQTLEEENLELKNRLIKLASENERNGSLLFEIKELEENNKELKKRLTTLGIERERHSSMLIEITELQANLSQRDLEIKELQHQLGLTEARQRQTFETSSSDSPEPNPSGFSNYSLIDKTYDSLAGRFGRQWDEETELHQQELDVLRGVSRNKAPVSHGNEEVLNLRQDIKCIRQALDSIVNNQGKSGTSFQEDMDNILEEKSREMERQETLNKQIMQTKEKLFNEVIKEKTQLINMLTEAKNKRQLSELGSDVWEKKMKGIVEKEMIKRFNELKIHIEGLLPKLSEKLPGGVVADAFKTNETAVKRLEEITEETWDKVRKELSELKDFTFEMADAIEKDIYSSHEQVLDFSKATSDDVIKCVRDEGYATRKSVLDQLQATRKPRDVPKFEEFYASLDTFGQRNSRELRQARRDVLLAAEAVTNTADELHHIKSSLESKLSVNEISNKNELADELTRRIQMIEAQDEVKELRKTVSDAQVATQLRDLVIPEKESRQRDFDRLRDILVNSSSSGEISDINRMEDGHRRSLSQIPPSRDYVTLRERLERRARERLSSDGIFQEPSTSTGYSQAWPRDSLSPI